MSDNISEFNSHSDELHYSAFICYRHLPLDQEAAELIQKKIERYTLPKEFRQKYGRKRFYRVFRDEDELPTSVSLTNSIYYALDHTEYLIVICTPDLPKSKWCEAEIRYFLKTHDRDHIIAVLADGTPDQSFSPYMLHDYDESGNILSDTEPLAANIAGENHSLNHKAVKKEVTRIYASFLGCSFDDLWQRERRAQTNRLLGLAGIVVAVMAVILGIILNRNAVIQQQNTELQRNLSAALVDSGMVKLKDHDILGALEDGIAAMQGDDPSIYDHRVGELFSSALGSYYEDNIRTSIVYSQANDITTIRISDDNSRLLLLDNFGVLRCLDLPSYSLLWELSVGDNSADIYTGGFGNRCICSTLDGVFCLSLDNGAVLWNHLRKDIAGNHFRALSDDGAIFAFIEQDNDKESTFLVFINTEDGTELGRTSLSEDTSHEPFIAMTTPSNEYAAAFSSDNSRFVCGLPSKDKENDDFNITYWSVDMVTFKRTHVVTYKTSPSLQYGISIDPADDSIFLAFYSSRHAGIITTFCHKENGKYESDNVITSHSFSSPGGIALPDYDANECGFLSMDGRIYITSDNELYIFNRKTNKLMQQFGFSSQVVNTWWADKDEKIMEIITSDGYVTDFTMDYGDDLVISKTYGKNFGLHGFSRCIPSGTGSISDTGSYYSVSPDSPGKLYLSEHFTDPNSSFLNPAPDDYEKSIYAPEIILAPDLDNGVFFHNDSIFGNNRVTFFNKNTGAIIGSAEYDDVVSAGSAQMLDNSHFLCEGKCFGVDGSVSDYAEQKEENRYTAEVSEDGTISIKELGKDTAVMLEQHYSDNEIAGLCFSDDDSYLLVLTTSGRLDVFDTEDYSRVFENTTDISLTDTDTDSLKSSPNRFSARPVYGKDLLFIRLPEERFLILDTANYNTVAYREGNSATYDSDTGRIYALSSTDNSKIITWPLYDIPALKAWAEDSVAHAQ